jgi:hypothetical protein
MCTLHSITTCVLRDGSRFETFEVDIAAGHHNMCAKRWVKVWKTPIVEHVDMNVDADAGA